jgi:hypothetical protein
VSDQAVHAWCSGGCRVKPCCSQISFMYKNVAKLVVAGAANALVKHWMVRACTLRLSELKPTGRGMNTITTVFGFMSGQS